MERLLTAAQAKAIDRYTIEEIGVPSLVLMERAALAVAEVCEERLREPGKRAAVLCVCGIGNNGADGVAVARILRLRGYETAILLAGDEARGTEELRTQLRTAVNLRIPVCKAYEPAEYIKSGEYGLIVDALFGVGLTRPIEGLYAQLIGQMNRCEASVVSVDLPSGISADDGKVMGCSVKAEVTVTFGEKKLGMVLFPGTEYCGKQVVAEIGLATRQYFGDEAVQAEKDSERQDPVAITFDDSDRKRLPKRPAYANKGTFGRVLVIAGSPNMGGAALFSGMSAYRMGSGLVEIATVKENRTFLLETLPEAVLTIYDREKDPSDWLIPAMKRAKAIVVGPGLGTDGNGEVILKTLFRENSVPLVIDADGLNLLAASSELQACLKDRSHVVVTPHLGEMSRLMGKTVRDIQQELIATATAYSRENGVICVMKDARTVVASPDGRIYVNTSGNCGMATAGMGDLLAGIISALAAERMELYEAACLGVFIHGRYGDLARDRYGERTMIASDLAKIIRETE